MKRIIFACGIALPAMLPILAQPSGQWDFNSGDLSATAGQAMQYSDGPGGATQTGTTFGSTTLFGIPDINGTPAQVMRFPAATNGQGYLMPTPVGPNGGGTLVNEYTIIFDVLYPQASDAKLRPLVDTDASFFVAGPDLAVGANNGIGITPSGPFSGIIASNTWYRVGFVVVQEQNTVTEYINGLKVGVNTITGSGQTGVDGRFALTPSSTALILGSTRTNAAAGYVNSIQIRPVALNSGQMNAIGGPSAAGILQNIPPVPSFVDSRTPDVNATGVLPKPNIRIVLHQGDTTINGSSIQLSLDGTIVPATVTPSVPTYTIAYSVPNLLDANSTHVLQLVYQDSVAGFNTNAWSFTVVAYPTITLPAPFAFETFDGIPEATLPIGWVATNRTSVDHVGFDLNDPQSDAYTNWVVISTNTLNTAKGAAPLAVPPIVVNGVLLTAMANNQLAYAESDSRGGSQVQVLFSPDFDCTGKTNVYLAFHSIYGQNQDDIAAVEYSIDGGVTWLPALYMLDDKNQAQDILRTNGVINITATFGTARTDQAYGLAYSNFIGAPVSAALIPFVSGRIDDDLVESIRVEVLRLAAADGQPTVRLRFMQAGTASWWFGIDNVGLYTINTPVIKTQPQSQTIDAATPVTFSVTADSITPLTYQWKFNGANIADATNSAYTIAGVSPTNAGQYRVVVSNADGPTPSNPATLTVVAQPQILTQPLSQVADPNATVTFTVNARGGRPLNYQWSFSETPAGANTNNLTLNAVQAANSGAYSVVITNTYGAVTSTVARLTVFSGSINSNLVAHLPFDGNYTDTSGRGNNATAVGSPGFASGKIGQAFQFTSKQDGSGFNYATLGYPADLKFSDTNDFSVSFWANYTQQADDPPFISNKNWDSSDNRGWGIFTQGGGNFRVNVTGPTTANKMSTTLPNIVRDGTWHNIVVSSIRGGFIYIYLDGLLVNTTPLLTAGSIDTDSITWSRQLGTNGAGQANIVTGPHSVNIGQDGTGAYNDCSGPTCPGTGGAGITNALIDDVGIWRRALTPNEAASIYAQGQKGQDLTTASGAPVVLPPTIADQPVSQTVNAGSDATFAVTAAGTGPFNYHWFKGETSLGVASSNLVLTAVQPAAAGDYAVIVGNAGGSITSQVARLSVFSGTISQSLVVHLRFDGNYTDSSGRGNNATAVGAPGFAAGKIGQAFRFKTIADGSEFDYATLGYPSDLRFATNDFSVAFWINYASASDDPAFIGNKNWDSSSNTGWGVFHQDPTDYLRVSCTGTPRGSANRMNATLSGPSLGDGNWHHVAVSFWRGQNAYIYVDGSLVNATPLTIAGSVDTDTIMWTRTLSTGTVTNQHNVNIGQEGTGSYNDCSGPACPASGTAGIDALIDDVGIWRRVITPQEAVAIFTAGNSGSDLSQAVVGPTALSRINVSVSGNTLNFSWTGGANIKLQKTTTLSSPDWQDVSGTDGNSTATETIGTGNAFYRLIKQ